MVEGMGLGSIAEVGATFAGFIAIFVVFSGKEKKLPDADILLAISMMKTSILLTIFALAPFALQGFVYIKADMWRILSFLAGGALILAIITQRRRERAMDSTWVKDIGVPTIIISYSIVLLAVLILWLNAFAVLDVSPASLYVVGLLLLLSSSALTFLIAVSARLR